VEAALDWRARENLSLSANYTLFDLDVQAPPPNIAINGEVAEGRSPHQQAQVRARWDVSDRVALDATAHYVDGLEGLDIQEYTRFDVRIGVRLTDELRLDLVGQNLGDSHPEFGEPGNAGLTEVERSFYGRLVWRR
jgi:iron complex outermembrane receptor protein